MTAQLSPAWLWPTARAIGWTPLAGIAACLALVAVAADGGWPATLVGVAAGSLAAAQVAGLHDPAAALLSAVPTSAAVRLARRLVLIVPTAVAVWASTIADHLVGLLVLTGVGVVVAVRAGVPWGAAAPLAWTVLALAAGVDWEVR